jgi:hypothetical protein
MTDFEHRVIALLTMMDARLARIKRGLNPLYKVGNDGVLTAIYTWESTGRNHKPDNTVVIPIHGPVS